MRRIAWVFVPVLLGGVPAVARGQLPPPGRPQPIPVIAPPEPGGRIAPGLPLAYTAPRADGPVAELLDEGIEPLFGQLVNDGGGEAGTITREDRDVFSGVEAARVTPMQK